MIECDVLFGRRSRNRSWKVLHFVWNTNAICLSRTCTMQLEAFCENIMTWDDSYKKQTSYVIRIQCGRHEKNRVARMDHCRRKTMGNFVRRANQTTYRYTCKNGKKKMYLHRLYISVVFRLVHDFYRTRLWLD